MIGATVKVDFDEKKLPTAMAKAKREVGQEFGRRVAARAIASIRPAVVLSRKSSRARTLKYQGSPADQPPRSRQGDLRKIGAAFDDATGSEVIGPTPTHGAGSDVPRRIEKGGDARLNGRVVRIKKRPYMQPALQAEAKIQMPSMFADTLR